MMTNSKWVTQPLNAILQFIQCLHFYIGFFIGPFIFIAALSGALYALTPQFESAIYSKVLKIEKSGASHSLAEQLRVAKASLDSELTLHSIRPAVSNGDTSRILFKDPSVDFSGIKAVFVDPVSLEVKGELPVYGTSGILPIRMKLDQIHRDLMLGEPGRYYTELAASWLWLTALLGIYLWLKGGKRNNAEMSSKLRLLNIRRKHGLLGLSILLGLLFVSATGLTWSKWAGDNISKLRAELGWITPAVSLSLSADGPADEHALHRMSMSAGKHHDMPNTIDLFDPILTLARSEGLDSGQIEIIPAQTMDMAWIVREIGQSWPTQVDTLAINPHSMTVTSRAFFNDFPLIAKLIRWGVDAHIGALFGVVNQVLIAIFGAATCAMIVWGYRMWWIKRSQRRSKAKTLVQTWMNLSYLMRALFFCVAVLCAFALPVLGFSLILFVLFDLVRWVLSSRDRNIKVFSNH